MQKSRFRQSVANQGWEYGLQQEQAARKRWDLLVAQNQTEPSPPRQPRSRLRKV